jgi:hypothetical protein
LLPKEVISAEHKRQMGDRVGKEVGSWNHNGCQTGGGDNLKKEKLNITAENQEPWEIFGCYYDLARRWRKSYMQSNFQFRTWPRNSKISI